MGENEIKFIVIAAVLALLAVCIFLLKVMPAGNMGYAYIKNTIAQVLLAIIVIVAIGFSVWYLMTDTLSLELPDKSEILDHSYKNKMIKRVESKYGQEISIPSPLYDDEEVDTAGSDDLALLADAVTPAGDHFTISYYEKFSILHNEVTIQDDYAKLLYDQKIRERTEEIMDQFLEKDEYTYDISYAMTDKTYADMDQIDDYLADTGTYIDADITISGADAEQATKKIYQLANTLKDHHMHFSFKLHYNGKEVIGDDSKDSPFLSYDELYHRIS